MKFTLKELKEGFYLTVFLIVMMIIASILLFGSCSTQKTFAEQEKELLTPEYNTVKVTWCTEKYVYYVDEYGHKGKFKNTFKDAFYVDEIIFKIFNDK